VESDVFKRFVWTGLLAATGAVASVAATRVAALIWRRIFHEDPPE
jgi:hypothetical protein